MKQPLAFRMRPTSIDEVIGQEHLVGKNGFLRNCLESDVALSMIYMVLLDVARPQ